MKVLTVVKNLGRGGTQRVAASYAAGYTGVGFQSAVLTLQESDGTGLASHIPLFGGISEVPGALEWAPDVVHIHRPGLANARETAVMERFRTAGAKIIETNVFSKPDYSRGGSCIDVHLLLTHWSLWKWRRWTTGRRRRAIGTVVANAIDVERFFPMPENEVARYRASLGIPAGAFVFGCVAQPHDLKWPQIIFDAFAEAVRGGLNAYFMVAGLSPNALRYVENMDLDVRDRVIVLPFIKSDDELRLCYSTMDVFLHGSDIGESFGLVFAESLLCGTPVISMSCVHKHNSQIEVVGHGRGGLIANDKTGLLRAINALAADHTARKEMASTGGEHVRRHYAREVVAQRLARLVEHVVHAGSREEMRSRLVNDEEFPTRVSRAEVWGHMSGTFGHIPYKHRVMSEVIHFPGVYRVWASLGLAR